VELISVLDSLKQLTVRMVSGNGLPYPVTTLKFDFREDGTYSLCGCSYVL